MIQSYIEKKPYYKPIESWVEENLKSGAKSKDDRRALLQRSLKTNSALASAVTELSKDLAKLIKQRKSALNPLWKLMREDYERPHSVPEARTTSVRRGLGKLMVLEPHVRQLVYENYKKLRGIPLAELPSYVFDLGFFDKRITGAHLTDAEITGVIDLLTPKVCEELLQRAPVSMQSWIDELHQLANVTPFLNFIVENFKDFTEAKTVAKLLTECQCNPEIFAQNRNIAFHGRLTRNWLFTILMDLVKASTGKLTGFGYAQLASDIGDSKDISSGYITIADWANCVPKVSLPDSVVLSVAEVLTSKLVADGKVSLGKLGSKLKEVTRKSILEDRLIPYRNFEPLLWLLETELKRKGIPYSAKAAFTGWINEYADVGRASATTPFVLVGSTLIHWKSVSNAGKDHKRKELSARARNTKYQYHPKKKTFTRREGVSQLALIVDGTFTATDMKTLAESGWDLIVYPDQISDFVRRLK